MAVATSQSAEGQLTAWDSVAASATDSALVTGVAGKKIRVLSVVINHASTASDVTFNSKGTGAGTAITPPLGGPTDGGFVIGQNDHGWFETNQGEGLTVTTGAGSNTSLIVTYKIVTGRGG